MVKYCNFARVKEKSFGLEALVCKYRLLVVCKIKAIKSRDLDKNIFNFSELYLKNSNQLNLSEWGDLGGRF